MPRIAFGSLALGAALALALAPRPAEAQVLRFSTTAPGRIIGAGNTLGLAKALNQNGPGTADSIGTFVALGNSVDDMPLNAANPWPMGTTYDWTKDGSTAVITVPVESQVLYAELVWGGGYNYGGEDVTASLDVPVTLTAGANTLSVTPDPATKLTLAQLSATGFPVNYYMRSADVTAFVTNAGSGTYAVSGVPASQSLSINSLNAAGWTLVVVLRDYAAPTRNLSVFVGGSFVDEDSQQDYTVSGFCTPPAGAFGGSVVISAIEGDANLVGDQLLIAPTAAGPFVNLEGPNNPELNFFCSQINGEDGLVDTQGSFGTANHDALTGVNVSGGRQGWDVTTVTLDSAAGQLQNGQTSAVLRTITTGDSYMPTLAAFAIDVNAPDFGGAGSTITTSLSTATIGDTIKVNLDLANTGQVPAEGVILKLPIDPGLSLKSFTMDGQSGDINGNPVDAAKLGIGVDAGDIGAGQVRHVILEADVVAPPAKALFFFEATWDYAFHVCVGGATLAESYTQVAGVQFDAPTTTAMNSVSSAASTSSSVTSSSSGNFMVGAGGSGGAGGAQGDGGATAGQEGGCSCRLPAESDARGRAALGLLAMAALAAARRRRR
jgi:uncharacterized repeat protein (TIGR01451 family)/MYXO-CTERM domain-containing protein